MGKLVRECNLPFGGIQICVSGDFFQLPPVPDKIPKCMRCNEESLATITAAESYLPYEELPEGVEQSEVYRCSDRIINGEKKDGCGLEMRKRRFAFETEAW